MNHYFKTRKPRVKICHRNKPVIHNPSPTAAHAICAGNAIRISFFTPDNDVYVELPVKFMPMKLVTAGIRKSQLIAETKLRNS